ncbi:hypothetical protein C943_02381 [Mariniradius saccharolyticus AK6]|uniref:Uncharacterized protein n=1 Tax=Mariniradius saccharolyticus AK6 TaxID=1239962 RepID=M7X8C8_9BACT|nr:hypothetical protein C943_02381 [Mariniradius saccharolyticus AK6]
MGKVDIPFHVTGYAVPFFRRLSETAIRRWAWTDVKKDNKQSVNNAEIRITFGEFFMATKNGDEYPNERINDCNKDHFTFLFLVNSDNSKNYFGKK